MGKSLPFIPIFPRKSDDDVESAIVFRISIKHLKLYQFYWRRRYIYTSTHILKKTRIFGNRWFPLFLFLFRSFYSIYRVLLCPIVSQSQGTSHDNGIVCPNDYDDDWNNIGIALCTLFCCYFCLFFLLFFFFFFIIKRLYYTCRIVLPRYTTMLRYVQRNQILKCPRASLDFSDTKNTREKEEIKIV